MRASWFVGIVGHYGLLRGRDPLSSSPLRIEFGSWWHRQSGRPYMKHKRELTCSLMVGRSSDPPKLKSWCSHKIYRCCVLSDIGDVSIDNDALLASSEISRSTRMLSPSEVFIG
jgi:hypothetical protein